MTTTEDTATAEAPTPAARRRARRPAGDSSPAPRRTRRQQATGEDLVTQLTAMVDRLIAENRDLKRAIARAGRGAGDGLGQATRALSGLQRRVSRALEAGPVGGRRGRGSAAAEASAAPRPRRKVTDPEVLERRRAALAKARAARAAKREAAAKE